MTGKSFSTFDVRILSITLLLFGSNPLFAEPLAPETELVSGDIPITKQMYLDRVSIMTPDDQRIANYSPQEARKVINDMYRRIKLVAEAKRQKLDQDELVKRKIAFMRDQELIAALQEKVRNSLVLPSFDEAAEEHYMVNKKDFMLPDRRAAKHILLESNENNTLEELTRQGHEILAKLQAGADFSELAKQFSRDSSSAKKGGDLGAVPRGRTVKAFEEALFSLEKPGDLSDLVVTKFGVHIIQLTEIIPAGPRPFDEVKSHIASNLREQWLQSKMRAWYEDVTKPENATSHEPRIDALISELSQAAKSKIKENELEK